ncbi:MAG: InlB B-repeat-containing protein [Solirubrobacterales bacterium]
MAPLPLAVPSASAAEGGSHPFIEKITGGAGDKGQRHPQFPFEDACGVAKDANGYLYVSDYYHDSIDVFSTAFGLEFLTTIPEVDPGNGPCGLAVDSSGDLFVNTWREGVVELTPASYPPGQFSEYVPRRIDSSGTATGLALDQGTGTLYVDDGSYISAYEASTGAPVEAGGERLRIGLDSGAEYFGLAVNEASGELYVAEAASGTVKIFEPAPETPPVGEIDGKGTPQGGFAYLGNASLAIDNKASSPSYGHLFVVDDIQHGISESPEAVVDEFNAQGDYRSQIARWFVKEEVPPGSGVKVLVEYRLTDGEPSGLALAGNGEVLVTNGNTQRSVLDVFGPTAPGRLLTVNLAGSGSGAVKSKQPGIDCPGACAAEYDEGSEVVLTASPDAHSAFAGWSGACSGTATTCRVTMTQAREVIAEFSALPQQNLSVSVEGSGEGEVTSEPVGIECSVGTTGSCAEHFNRDSTVILTARPAPHTRFKEWVGLPCDESTSPTCSVTMSGDEAIAARFEAIPPQALQVSVSGQGLVTSEPAGISCPGTCAGEFDEGSTVTLTAAPVAHQELVAWSGCGGEPAPGRCEVQMSEAKAVEAVFGPIHRTVAVAVAGHGTVTADHGQISTCTGSCSGIYLDGEELKLEAASAPGYQFAGWSGGCGGSGACHLTIESDLAVVANFTAIPEPPPPPPPGTLKLTHVRVNGARAILVLEISGPGLIAVHGAHIRGAHLHARRGGKVTLRLGLDARAKRRLATGRTGSLKAQVTIAFSPADGGAAARVRRGIEFRRGR